MHIYRYYYLLASTVEVYMYRKKKTVTLWIDVCATRLMRLGHTIKVYLFTEIQLTELRIHTKLALKEKG